MSDLIWREDAIAALKDHLFHAPVYYNETVKALRALPAAPVTVQSEDAIDALRLKAFETNAPADRDAYFNAVSRWFQNRPAAPDMQALVAERERADKLLAALIEATAELIYLRKYAHLGGRWEANESKDVWRDYALRALADTEGGA